MKTIILCGGQGTRLKEETEFKPKPMVYVGGKPILWHIMKIYSHYGYNDFVLALGYKADYIKDYFLNQKAFSADFTLETKDHKTTFYLEKRREVDNFKITFVDTGIDTLPGERILRCQEYVPEIDEDFMITYGDGVSNIPLNEVYTFHKNQKTIGTICGVHPRSKYGLLEINKNQHVEKFIEKPVLSDWVNGGFMFFKRSFFKYLRERELEHEGLKRLIAKDELSLYQHDDFWFGIDTYKELEDLNTIWNTSSPWKIWK
ncbi:glucose-1-phosphate cytidylyltransferase [Candidatus Falkowbacteria bacterium CG11_big_fil_rev_8_21_14_0_20_39_10]|uniref:Glucose-1-phosphate cytidylyltransferase n=1 Tax=Candidatus Falkowbacteria bacterium CG11_big_fil_rev_8_21_14_0_20_39_10 TaxID=1974570 RepID=A0A2M6K9M9_9BACT|nr:MAG: glucose-1-phosphate cytidylyltransferase [Candidatus Falkowbacteria bacterium CG11_big_fil_rev_8_21_14_0_20_39_10]